MTKLWVIFRAKIIFYYNKIVYVRTVLTEIFKLPVAQIPLPRQANLFFSWEKTTLFFVAIYEKWQKNAELFQGLLLDQVAGG